MLLPILVTTTISITTWIKTKWWISNTNAWWPWTKIALDIKVVIIHNSIKETKTSEAWTTTCINKRNNSIQLIKISSSLMLTSINNWCKQVDKLTFSSNLILQVHQICKPKWWTGRNSENIAEKLLPVSSYDEIIVYSIPRNIITFKFPLILKFNVKINYNSFK